MDKAEYALIMDKAEFAAEIVIQHCAKSLTKNFKTGRRIERDMFLFMKYFTCTVLRHVSSRRASNSYKTRAQCLATKLCESACVKSHYSNCIFTFHC